MYKQIGNTKAMWKMFLNNIIYIFIIPAFMSCIGGYNNIWKPLKENLGLYCYTSQIYEFIAIGINYRLLSQFNILYINHKLDFDLHIIGINITPLSISIIKILLKLFSKVTPAKILLCFITNIIQLVDVEIKVWDFYIAYL